MAAPRKQEIELNFDGLTDSVTNLVGALILIVVLVISITQRAVYTPPPESVVAESGADEADRPLETIAELLRELDALNVETVRIRDGVTRIEQRIPEWRTSVDGAAREEVAP